MGLWDNAHTSVQIRYLSRPEDQLMKMIQPTWGGGESVRQLVKTAFEWQAVGGVSHCGGANI